MKTITTLCFILLLAVSGYAQPSRQLVQGNSTETPRRLALVIGNATYQNAPPLKNPANDAMDIAERLTNVGFNVDHGINLTQRQMKAKIRDFGQKLKGGGQGLFYFAGHGVQLRGRNYLIPVDADIQSETDVEDQGVDANLMLGMMDEAGNGLNVIILDACRNNPFGRSFRSASNGLAQMDAPSGTLIAYATSPGSVASDGNTRNGLYTQELLKSMMIPGLKIEEVFKRVRISVRNSSAGKQTPWEASSLTGDFYFNLPGQAAASQADTEVTASQPERQQPSNASEPANAVSEGSLEGKIVSKPVPAYPPIAKATRAGGPVVVQVTVDETGSVISAQALGGHALLRMSAVQAAKSAKFRPTVMGGKPVKVTGTITYNFVLEDQ